MEFMSGLCIPEWYSGKFVGVKIKLKPGLALFPAG
jgi:hypothetical protein